MTDICERHVVRRPKGETAHHLALLVAQHCIGNGRYRIALRLPLEIFAAWEWQIERPGIASIYALGSADDLHPTYSVTWSAQSGGPFPEFAGALAVEQLPGDDCCGLILCGHYEPPLGKAGALFDALLGRRIAHGSARDLLQSIVAQLETRSPPHGGSGAETAPHERALARRADRIAG